MAEEPIANGEVGNGAPAQPTDVQVVEEKGDLKVALHEARQEKARVTEELAQAKATELELRQQLENASNSGLTEEQLFEKELSEHSLSRIHQEAAEELEKIPGTLGERFKKNPFSIVEASEVKVLESTSRNKVEFYQKLANAAIGEIRALSTSFAPVTPPSTPTTPEPGATPAAQDIVQGGQLTPFQIAQESLKNPNFALEQFRSSVK